MPGKKREALTKAEIATLVLSLVALVFSVWSFLVSHDLEQKTYELERQLNVERLTIAAGWMTRNNGDSQDGRWMLVRLTNSGGASFSIRKLLVQLPGGNDAEARQRDEYPNQTLDLATLELRESEPINERPLAQGDQAVYCMRLSDDDVESLADLEFYVVDHHGRQWPIYMSRDRQADEWLKDTTPLRDELAAHAGVAGTNYGFLTSYSYDLND